MIALAWPIYGHRVAATISITIIQLAAAPFETLREMPRIALPSASTVRPSIDHDQSLSVGLHVVGE